MIRLFLITGFLGAGKTTFLQNWVRRFTGQRLAILVNEFGKTDVDGTLLSTLAAAVAEVHNGSIFCSCRQEQFEQTLATLAEDGPDVIFIEASGLSDPAKMEQILMETERFAGISYQGCICLADAVLFQKVLATANVCRKQLEACHLVLLNKTDLVSPEQREQIHDLIRSIRPDVPILDTQFGMVPDRFPEQLCQAVLREPWGSRYHTKDITLQSRLLVLKDGLTGEKLDRFLRQIAPASYRIKGFVQLASSVCLVDCVADSISVSPWNGQVPECNRLTVHWGKGLPLASALKQYQEEEGSHSVLLKTE